MRFMDLCDKAVVCASDCRCLGHVSDIEFAKAEKLKQLQYQVLQNILVVCLEMKKFAFPGLI